ncbi:MAG: sigma 54-interacting transcriptional regulator, partial [Spirochaetales bacterium]|nr:sigma 54-interacting transcriptional regulator [Spirochaetales bacterium]
TLFLDEIGEMPAHMQVKILRTIQDRKVTRLGGTKGLPIDARIVAATNRNLESMVAEGTFREDLYYRINVVRIHLPPLRERPGDSLSLARYFVETLAPVMGRKGAKLAPDAIDFIASYSFPGNVRELSNAVERALILADSEELHAADFGIGSGLQSMPTSRTKTEQTIPQFVGEDGSPYTLAQMEKLAIIAALKRNAGKREASATELGITRRTLLNKLNEYGYSD